MYSFSKNNLQIHDFLAFIWVEIDSQNREEKVHFDCGQTLNLVLYQ